MKLRKKVLIILMSCLISSNIYGVSIEDTFTIGNIDNTISTDNATYIVTNTGSVMAIGNYIMGAGTATNTSSDEWIEIKKNLMGDPMDNIVAVELARHTMLLLDNKGSVYQLGISSDMATGSVNDYMLPNKIDISDEIIGMDLMLIDISSWSCATALVNKQ